MSGRGGREAGPRRSDRGGRRRGRVQQPDGRSGQARRRAGRPIGAALVRRGTGGGRGRTDRHRHLAGSDRRDRRRADWLPDSVVAVVAGGARRQESVAAGVAALVGAADAGQPTDADRGRRARLPRARPIAARDPVILVHDAARPLASPALVRAVAAAAAVHGAAIPVLRRDRNAQASRRRSGRRHRRPNRRGGRPDSAGRPAQPARAGLRRLSSRRPRDLDRRGLPAGGL